MLDFPFQLAAQDFAARSQSAQGLADFFRGDDWYTDADSNVYQLPTFLGNHDMGRFGLFVRQGNPGAGDPEVFARDRLGHELMYFSRGNPVIYYGDEQGFVGDGGDQLARQDMFESQVAEYNDDDLIGTDATTAAVELRPLARPVPRDRTARGRDARPPRAARRRPPAPLRRRRSGHLRVLAPRPRRPARVRRRAEQLRVRADGGDPDVDRLGHVHARLRRRARRRATATPTGACTSPCRRCRPSSTARRSGSRRAPARRRSRSPSRPRAARARPARGPRRRRRRLVLRGDVRGQGRRRRLAGHRHGRQRALPRLPRRVADRAGHGAPVPRDRARQRPQPAHERGAQRRRSRRRR